MADLSGPAVVALRAPDPARAAGGGLSAEVCARAIIAAALSFGEDPAAVCASPSTKKRKVLCAAAGGLAVAEATSLNAASRVLRLHKTSVHHARAKDDPAYDRAEAAAAEAATWALKAAQEAAAPPCPPPRKLTPPPGPIAASLRPGAPKPPVALEDTPCRDLVLIALEAAGALDSANIASAIDRKEMLVIGALRQLEHEGAVACEPNPGGTRPLRWTVAADA